MALKQTISLVDQFDESITFTNAYLRVDRIEGGKLEIMICLGFYKNQEAKRPLVCKTYKFHPKLDGVNFVAQAYEYLKTLPEFTGATDC